MPISSRGNWYVPVSLLIAVSGCNRIGAVSVTVAPGSTAPDWSVTLPKISPVCDCADAVATPVTNIASRTSTAIRNLILILLTELQTPSFEHKFRSDQYPIMGQYPAMKRTL